MEYLMILLLIFIAVLFLMQVVFFEITKSKMEKMNNINWFLSLDKPLIIIVLDIWSFFALSVI